MNTARFGSVKISVSSCRRIQVQNVVDPTGAGDSFAGGFMGYIGATGETDAKAFRQAVIAGSVIASFTVEGFGLDRLANLSTDEIERLFRGIRRFDHIRQQQWFAIARTATGELKNSIGALMNYDITDINLAREGALKSEWADQQMPVLQGIRQRFAETRPLEGIRIAACLHVTSETSNLAKTLVAGGAELALCASNPLSTQDDIAAHLVDEGISVFARNGEDSDTYYQHISDAVDTKPHLTIDDGADLGGDVALRTPRVA